VGACCLLCEQLTVIRLVMRDSIEEELYDRNNKSNVAEVSLNFSSGSSISTQLGVQVSHTHTHTHTHTLNHHCHHQHCRHCVSDE